MIRIYRWRLTAIALFLAQSSTPQSHSSPMDPSARSLETYLKILDNTRKLALSMKLDRSEYFPGEDATLAISIFNPTSVALEVFAPFHGQIDLYGRFGDASWAPLVPHPSNGIEEYAPRGGQESVKIGGGARIERTFVFADPGTRHIRTERGPTDATTVCTGCMIPEQEGEYRLCYTYGHQSCAGFRLVIPILEQWSEVVLNKPFEYRGFNPSTRQDEMKTARRVLRVAILGYEGTHVAVISAQPIVGGRWHPELNTRLTTPSNRELGEYRRLAVANAPVTSIRANADKSENTSIEFTDQSGKRYMIRLDSTRRILQ